MLIIAGHLVVAEPDRDRFVEDCREVVVAARVAPGCQDFSITADTVDPTRINIHERWDSEAELLAFRGDDPSSGSEVSITGGEVRRYLISAVTDA